MPILDAMRWWRVQERMLGVSPVGYGIRGSWLARLASVLALVGGITGVAALVPQAAGASTPICETGNGVIGNCPSSVPGISYSPSEIAFGYEPVA